MKTTITVTFDARVVDGRLQAHDALVHAAISNPELLPENVSVDVFTTAILKASIILLTEKIGQPADAIRLPKTDAGEVVQA